MHCIIQLWSAFSVTIHYTGQVSTSAKEGLEHLPLQPAQSSWEGSPISLVRQLPKRANSNRKPSEIGADPPVLLHEEVRKEQNIKEGIQ